jgi:hypothetical protein
MNPKQYTVKSTSHATAKVNDVQISVPENPETARTRRVLRTQIVNNTKDPAACVQMTLMHQKRHGGKEDWQDANSFNATRLKAGEEIKLDLSCGQTRRIYETLKDLYAVSENGVPVGEQNLVVVNEGDSFVATGREKDLINKLLEQEGEDFFEEVNKLQPDLFEAAAIAKVHRGRRKTVEEFAKALETMRWTEEEWDTFFRNNKWIFGHGLAYQFLSQLESQPQYGGVTVSGTGGQRGDFLMSTEAQARFTVLVEIKKPNSELVSDKLYQNKVYELGKDLTGGVSQLQSNCRTWVVEGSRQDENRERLAEFNASTYEPKGILVVGHTDQLDSNTNKKATFEMFRRNLHNPEIITYDELLERAKYLVSLK